MCLYFFYDSFALILIEIQFGSMALELSQAWEIEHMLIYSTDNFVDICTGAFCLCLIVYF